MVPGAPAGEGRGGQHRRQHHEENISIIQLDHTFMHDPHQAPQRSYTILTAIELTTGLRTAVKKVYTPNQGAQLHRWIVKHGFTKSILQSQMLRHRSCSLSAPLRQTSTSLQECHLLTHIRSSQGKDTTRLQWSCDLKNVESKSSLICFLQSHFSGHFDTASSLTTTTSFTLPYNYRSNIVGFGECVLGDVRNIRINIRNLEASGLDVTSSPMSTSLHYLFNTVNNRQRQHGHTNADSSLVYLEKNSMTSTS